MIQQHERRSRLGCFLLLGLLLTLSPLRAPAAASPPLPEGLATPAQATPMPAFALPDPDGKPVRSADLQGKIIVVRFWATW
jgi:cytochrome oxidase Cu insertion factor (SCO1/SenC/PrrC family)